MKEIFENHALSLVISVTQGINPNEDSSYDIFIDGSYVQNTIQVFEI
jgi:hypothetical protein